MDEFVIAVLGGGVVALLLLGVPKSALKKLGKYTIPEFNNLRPFAPNWITLYSAIIALCGLKLYEHSPVIGVMVAVFGCMLDRMDGKIAHSVGLTLAPPDQWTKGMMDYWFAEVTDLKGSVIQCRLGKAKTWPGRWLLEFNFSGATDLGAVFDPFMDKVKGLAMLAFFANYGVISLWLVGFLMVPELLGTAIRRPFYMFQKHVGQGKATAVGKYKVMIQWMVIIFSIPFHKGWIEPGHWAYHQEWALDALLILSIFLAFASVLSRFRWAREQKEVREVIQALDKSAEHE